MAKVAVNIVTFNSARDIATCLESVLAQTFKDVKVQVLDNDSHDGTREVVARYPVERIDSAENTGFSRAHNRLIRSAEAEYVLVLNPDTRLEPTFVAELVRAMDARSDAASASGKLLRMDASTPPIIDSTGIVMQREQRHFDRGADTPDTGQFDNPEDIFGPSGAAAFYRRSALEDVAVFGEYFDEDFFAYREDADLAWRCQLLGWASIYVPTAVARHRRRVTPERRSELPKVINYHSVKNRFLLRLNNMTPGLYWRDLLPITVRDAAVVGYVLLREHQSVPALWYVPRHLPRLWRKRQSIQARRRADPEAIARWFRR